MSANAEKVEFEYLLGKSISNITVNRGNGADVLTFAFADGAKYEMRHRQDCSEDVQIDDIVGDLDDLLGSPLTMAEEVTNQNGTNLKLRESFTWTFYKFATVRGYVTIRWYGCSDGYYSERVDFIQIEGPRGDAL